MHCLFVVRKLTNLPATGVYSDTLIVLFHNFFFSSKRIGHFYVKGIMAKECDFAINI